MPERWIPIVAAAVGLLGGLGGAALGGYIANEGQEDRLRQERTAQLNGLLIGTYSRYVRTAASAYATLTIGKPSVAKQSRVLGELEAGAGEVSFVTNDRQVRTAADDLEQAVIDQAEDDVYRTRRDRFIQLAGESLIPEPNINE